MNRARAKHRLMAWTRYTARYIRPPHGVMGVVENLGLMRAEHNFYGRRTPSNLDRIAFRHWRRS